MPWFPELFSASVLDRFARRRCRAMIVPRIYWN